MRDEEAQVRSLDRQGSILKAYEECWGNEGGGEPVSKRDGV